MFEFVGIKRGVHTATHSALAIQPLPLPVPLMPQSVRDPEVIIQLVTGSACLGLLDSIVGVTEEEGTPEHREGTNRRGIKLRGQKLI